jgi:hypothetical protein
MLNGVIKDEIIIVRNGLLLQLLKMYEEHGPKSYALANSIPEFKENPYLLVTINKLLAEELIIGVEAHVEDQVAIGINPLKRMEIIRQLGMVA